MEFFTPYNKIIIQVDDVIPILPPVVGWVAAATLVVMFLKDFWNVVCELCLVLGSTKMWLIGFHILVFIMLYGLVTSTLWGFYYGNFLLDTGE